VNPVTGEVDATIPLADAAAHAAFDGWRRTAPARRRELLLKLADLMEQHGDEIARLALLKTGAQLDPDRPSLRWRLNGPATTLAGPTRSSVM
jgi:acyl-CoA reductase-like NAD-dependent aldehyde dehydrogenase